MSTQQVQMVLMEYLINKGYKVFNNDGYLFAEGDLPICLVAHMDTVLHRVPYDFFYDKQRGVLFSPDTGLGADDRAGIYAILYLINAGYRPSVIFTDKEECGGIGARSLVAAYPACPFKECKAIIELDRANKNDCVFYDCDNESFERLINSYGFKTDIGSFSDISVIAPTWKIAAVNLSIGYYNEHTHAEYFNIYECHKTIEKVKRMLVECKNWVNYDYVPFDYSKYGKYGYMSPYYSKYMYDEKPWWNKCTCAVCGKSLANNEGRFVATPLGYELICDNCKEDDLFDIICPEKASYESPQED